MTALLPATAPAIAEAGLRLRRGALVAFPTETVYGLGADARSNEAVAKIYAAKSRPSFNPLIAHVASRAAAARQGIFDANAAKLAEAFWPGPLTLVLPAAGTCTVSHLARAGLDSVALRMPVHPVALALIDAADCPVAAPSANRSGRISPTEAGHVLAELDGRVDLILDGGACAVGVESTILSCLGEIHLLRPGGVSRESIEAVLGQPIASRIEGGEAPLAPGMLVSHYAPRAGVRLNATEVRSGEAVLDFGGRLAGQGAPAAYLDLSASRDLNEAAAHLFAFLRQLDAFGVSGIAVVPVPDEGLGEAINDRLRRAAAPRD
jgi:L-threonylcarbamoyladenylate synthase